ncbi:MAG: hypothetical protein KGL39_41340, partial [Patescibacteria group bacterium]|nr:hypothetical protein [Patescibacteria group bacterium]
FLGLDAPSAVTTATASYRADQDAIGAFLAERCTTLATATVKASLLHEAYLMWAKENGDAQPLNATAFGRTVHEHGFAKDRLRNGWHYRGLGLVVETEKV